MRKPSYVGREGGGKHKLCSIDMKTRKSSWIGRKERDLGGVRMKVNMIKMHYI